MSIKTRVYRTMSYSTFDEEEEQEEFIQYLQSQGYSDAEIEQIISDNY